MTVSNAFSRPDQLSAALRERILATADELGYCGPDPAARTLARGSSGAIGVLLTDSLSYAFTDAVSTRFLGAMAAELEPAGVAITLLSSPRRTDEAPPGNVALDGVIVYSVDSDSPALPWLRRRALPLVFVDQKPEAGISSINIDDRSGAQQAAQHLVDLGHRRIGIVIEGLRAPYRSIVDPSVGSVHHVVRERLGGWLDVLAAAGIEPIVANQQNNSLTESEFSAQLLLDRADRPTAVLCMTDLMALGVLNIAESLALSVPDDLSVVGFDDAPLAMQTRPTLTTVRQSVEAKGRAAAVAIMAAIKDAQAGNRKTRAKHTVFPTELVVRSSSARAPQASSPVAGRRAS
jgi:DNA-binding LacI/PurR family transcriptional regulator